jgi:hypothetical protein
VTRLPWRTPKRRVDTAPFQAPHTVQITFMRERERWAARPTPVQTIDGCFRTSLRDPLRSRHRPDLDFNPGRGSTWSQTISTCSTLASITSPLFYSVLSLTSVFGLVHFDTSLLSLSFGYPSFIRISKGHIGRPAGFLRASAFSIKDGQIWRQKQGRPSSTRDLVTLFFRVLGMHWRQFIETTLFPLSISARFRESGMHSFEYCYCRYDIHHELMLRVSSIHLRFCNLYTFILASY